MLSDPHRPASLPVAPTLCAWAGLLLFLSMAPALHAGSPPAARLGDARGTVLDAQGLPPRVLVLVEAMVPPAQALREGPPVGALAASLRAGVLAIPGEQARWTSKAPGDFPVPRYRLNCVMRC